MLGLKQGILKVPKLHHHTIPLIHRPTQLLQLQSLTPAALRLSQTAAHLSTTPTPSMTSPDIPRILSFWFDHPGPEPAKRWFMGGAALDAEIKSHFQPLVTQARTTALDTWTSSPTGTLALLLLLDQFPRNIYRGTAAAFASDAKALDIATTAIATGVDHALPPVQAAFIYMPLMHAESLLAQVAGCALFDNLRLRAEASSDLSDAERQFLVMTPPFAQRHRDAIVRFGRFCGRNEVLGRESTVEEAAHLKENPMGF